jgi:hypothetical protein
LAALKNPENKKVQIVALKMVRVVINSFATFLKNLGIFGKIGFSKPDLLSCSVASEQFFHIFSSH